FKEDPYKEVELALKEAPIKSTSSSSCSLVLLVVPAVSISPTKPVNPALSPSTKGSLSRTKEKATLGSLSFSTTKTLIPLSNVNSSTSPSLISGAGPGSGNLVLSICATAAELNSRDMISNMYGFFIVVMIKLKNYS